MRQRNVAKYLQLLRRVPDDVILAVGARDIDPGEGYSCVCGWVMREHLARLANHGRTADDIDPYNPPSAELDAMGVEPDRYSGIINIYGDYRTAWSPGERCVRLYGGDGDAWMSLYNDAPVDPAVEEAFTLRVMEAAGVA